MGWFDDVTDAVSNVVSDAGDLISDGADAVGGAVSDAAGAVAGAAESVWNQETDAIETFADGIFSAGKGVFQDLYEAGGKMGEGFEDLFEGNIGDAFSDWGSGLFQGFLQTPFDAALMIGARGVSAIETAVGVEPVGRKLTDEEIKELRKVFGDSLDYSKIRVKEGDDLMTIGAARTIGDTIYIPEGKLTPDLLVHESTHVWQYQHGGDDYMGEALYGQTFGEGYDYQQGIDEGKSWSELNPEQQAELIQQAYKNGFFDTGMWSGRADLTAYMNDVLNQLRAGNGAT